MNSTRETKPPRGKRAGWKPDYRATAAQRNQLQRGRAHASFYFRKVFCALFPPRMTHKEVGRRLHISRQAVQSAEEQIFWKIWSRIRDPKFHK